MPINKNAFRRYRIIDRCIRSKTRPFPTMQELKDACWNKLDADVSEETIQKDIAAMKLPDPDGFDAPIKFNRKHMGYEYTNPEYSLSGSKLDSHDIEALKEVMDLLEGLGGSRLQKKFNFVLEKLSSKATEELNQDEKNRKILLTDRPPTSRGFEHFDLLFRACKERIPISLVHYSYRKRAFKSLIAHPILLKEFDNRWYVVAYSELHQTIRTFGFDRIYEPHLIQKTYIKVKPTEIKPYLEDIYGVFPLSDNGKELIEIHASPMSTNYFQAYPIHDSQHIELLENGSSKITFKLIPSMELIQLFMSHGKSVRVSKPLWMNYHIEGHK